MRILRIRDSIDVDLDGGHHTCRCWATITRCQRQLLGAAAQTAMLPASCMLRRMQRGHDEILAIGAHAPPDIRISDKHNRPRFANERLLHRHIRSPRRRIAKRCWLQWMGSHDAVTQSCLRSSFAHALSRKHVNRNAHPSQSVNFQFKSRNVVYCEILPSRHHHAESFALVAPCDSGFRSFDKCGYHGLFEHPLKQRSWCNRCYFVLHFHSIIGCCQSFQIHQDDQPRVQCGLVSFDWYLLKPFVSAICVDFYCCWSLSNGSLHFQNIHRADRRQNNHFDVSTYLNFFIADRRYNHKL